MYYFFIVIFGLILTVKRGSLPLKSQKVSVSLILLLIFFSKFRPKITYLSVGLFIVFNLGEVKSISLFPSRGSLFG